MSRASIEQEIRRIVRDELLLGSDRPIPRDQALGEVGIGLDSLALVNLLNAVEQGFGVELSDDVWTARGPITLDDLVEVVHSTPATTAAATTNGRDAAVKHRRMDAVELALRRRGWPGRAAWAVVQVAAPAASFVFSGGTYLLFERELDAGASMTFALPPGVELRPFRPEDEAGFAGLWAPYEERIRRRTLRRYLREGALGLVAAEGSRIVAIDFLSATGDDEVEISRPDVCYAFALSEAPSVRGRGIGLALADYSVRVARERGFRTQVTYVWDGNEPMLAAATQLLGFRQIGSGRRRRVLGVRRWSWEVDGQPGSGPRLRL